MTNKGKMIEAIYAACLTKRATLVIFYLINRANQELTCFPSVGTIARECNMSTRTVQRALNDLEEAGFLERESRFHNRGGQKSSLFKINPVVACDKKIEEVNFNDMNTINEINKEITSIKYVDKITCTEPVEIEFENSKKENAVIKLLKKIQNTFLHLLSWGL